MRKSLELEGAIHAHHQPRHLHRLRNTVVFERRSEHPVETRFPGAVFAPEFGVSGRVQDQFVLGEQEVRIEELATLEAHEEVDDRTLFGADLLIERRRQLERDGCDVVAKGLEDDLVARIEVVGRGAARHAGRFGDPTVRDRLDAPLSDDTERCSEERASLLLTLGQARGNRGPGCGARCGVG